MTREELLRQLREMGEQKEGDTEGNHLRADDLLLDFIDDPEVKAAFDAIGKWYA